MINKKEVKEVGEKSMSGFVEYYSNPKYAILDGGAVILGLIVLIFSIMQKGVGTGLLLGVVAIALLLGLAQLAKKIGFEEPCGTISEEEPEEPTFVTYNGMQPGDAKRLKQKEKEELAEREANGEFILGKKDVKRMEKNMEKEEKAQAKAEKKAEKEEAKAEKRAEKEEAERLKQEQLAAGLDLATLDAATAQKETLAGKVGKGLGAVVDAKNSVKRTLLTGKTTLDEFADLVVKKGTSLSELIGEPVFSNIEVNKTAPLNAKVDNGIYSGAFELVEAQKVPYYGFSAVLLKLLDGDMYSFFDTSVPWSGVPFNVAFIGHVDKIAKDIATLKERSARIAIWIKTDTAIHVLETSFLSTKGADENAWNDIKKYMLTLILTHVGKEAKDTYIDSGVCDAHEEVLNVAKAAKANMDKSIIQGQCDFKIPDILLGIQGTETNVKEEPKNLDTVLTSLEGLELKRCINSSDSSFTLHTYALDSLAARKFFKNSDSMIKLNTTVFKPALVQDMLTWVVGQYSEVADSIAFDISSGIGLDTIHVLSCSEGITIDAIKDAPGSFLSGIFRMNSTSAYSGVSTISDIRVIVNLTGKELYINSEDYNVKKLAKMEDKSKD